MDDPYKQAAEAITKLKSSLGESAFSKVPEYLSMKPPYIPSEAELALQAIGQEIEKWKARTPENKHLVLMLGTMDVVEIDVLGRFAYRAIGYVNGEHNMIVGHVATLTVRGFYEDNASGKRAGFRSFNQSQPESEQRRSDST